MIIKWFEAKRDTDMDSFGKKLRESSEAKGISQTDLAKLLNTSYSVRGKYERGGTKKISGILNGSVAYLLSETQEANLFKNPAMLKTLDEIEKLDEKNKSHILSVPDGFLQYVKFKNMAAL